MSDSPDQLISAEHVDVISEVLKERIGETLGNTDPRFLRKFLTDRFRELGCRTAKDYLAKLDEPMEFRRVLDGLTVPETFFFRFETQLDAFRQTLLPGLLKDFSKLGKIRIWSAGCCTGEEPYTLALIAADLGLLNRVEILATDINPTYLERAAEPRFTDRSVSRVPRHLLNTYFKKDARGWTLSDEITKAVTFRALNLNENLFPSPITGTVGCHLVFCRNVLIYFSQSKALEIINRLGTCLVPGGYLALGHAEFNFSPRSLEIKRVDGAFFFHLPGKETKVLALAAKKPPETAAPKPEPKKTHDDLPLPGMDRVRTLAEQGKIPEAIEVCQKIVSRNPLNFEAYFFEGFLLRDNPERSVELFQKVLYLNPNHLLGRLELARSLELVSRPADAIREYRELIRQTSQRDPSEVIPAADGITVGLLSILCQRALTKIEKQAA